MSSINLLAVLVSAISAFVLGFLFHGPVLGKLWMKLANIVPTGNEKFSDMVPQMIGNLIANIVSATALSFLFIMTSPSAWCGVVLAVWLGFIVTSSSMEVLWMKRRPALWLFECFCSLATMIVMGLIIANW